MLYIFLIIWWILALIDLSFTYTTIKQAKEFFKNTDYTQFERNKLPRFFIKTFGLKLGIFLHCIFMILLIYAVVSIVYIFVESLYFIFGLGLIIGLYSLMIVIHFNNYRYFKKLKNTKQNPNKKQYVDEIIKIREKEFKLIDKIKGKE